MADTPPASRPTKLTTELQADLCESLKNGVDRRHACETVGISLRTFQGWLARGRRREAPFSTLLSHVKKAEADAVAFHVGQIRKASEEGTWQASAWWLERRHPDIYGSDRKRVRELERMVAELVKGAASARKPVPRRKASPPRPRPAGGGRHADSRH